MALRTIFFASWACALWGRGVIWILMYIGKKTDMRIQELFELQLMMFILIGVGVVLKRLNIITKEGRGLLTDLVIDVILPCNIITAFSKPFDQSILISGLHLSDPSKDHHVVGRRFLFYRKSKPKGSH